MHSFDGGNNKIVWTVTVEGDIPRWPDVKEELPRLRKLDPRTALLLDGAEQLSTLSWLALRWRTRNAGAFVVTSHREGRLPTLLRCETSPEILLDLLDDLAPDRPCGFPSAEALWRKHDGDLRQALFEAYDRWAELG